MTKHDVLTFGLGTDFGVYLVLAVQFVRDIIDDRRDRKVLDEHLAKLAAADKEATRAL